MLIIALMPASIFPARMPRGLHAHADGRIFFCRPSSFMLTPCDSRIAYAAVSARRRCDAMQSHESIATKEAPPSRRRAVCLDVDAFAPQYHLSISAARTIDARAPSRRAALMPGPRRPRRDYPPASLRWPGLHQCLSSMQYFRRQIRASFLAGESRAFSRIFRIDSSRAASWRSFLGDDGRAAFRRDAMRVDYSFSIANISATLEDGRAAAFSPA